MSKTKEREWVVSRMLWAAETFDSRRASQRAMVRAYFTRIERLARMDVIG